MKRRGLTLHKELLTTNNADNVDGGTITISVTFGTACPTANVVCTYTQGASCGGSCDASCGGGCGTAIECVETRQCNTQAECQSILVE